MNTATRISHTALGVSLLLALAACSKPADEKAETVEAAPHEQPAIATETSEPTFESLDKKVSYGIGINIGTQIAADQNIEIDLDSLFAGLRDATAGKDPRLSDEELRAAFEAINARAQEAQAAKARESAQASAAFLETNKQRPEITTTDSGLQYEVLQSGDGEAKPTTSNTVRVHYHGTLVDGTVFDSSVDRGEPIEFAVTGVISGWTEALQLMTVGDKWKLYIPSEHAYGERGRPGIPPNSALIFEVELLEIK